MQKSIAQKALQCLCPHMNSIFSQLLLIYLPRQADASWGLLPILCHQRWTGVKTQQSMCWETELVQKPWFTSPSLHTHLYLFPRVHIAKRTPIIGRTISASCLIPSVHNFSLPLSLRCIKFQGRPKMLLIWTFPRTVLHHRSISAQPVKWGGFWRLLSPLALFRAAHCMWKNIMSCYTSPRALISLHGCIPGRN